MSKSRGGHFEAKGSVLYLFMYLFWQVGQAPLVRVPETVLVLARRALHPSPGCKKSWFSVMGWCRVRGKLQSSYLAPKE